MWIVHFIDVIYVINKMFSVLFNSIQRSEMSSEGGGVKFGMEDPSFQHVGPQLSDVACQGSSSLGGC